MIKMPFEGASIFFLDAARSIDVEDLEGELVQIVVDLPEGSEATAETLWSRRITSNRFRLLNVPVWAYGLAYEDIVEGVLDEDQRIHFVRLFARSGLFTVRAAGPNANPDAFSSLVDTLKGRSVAVEAVSDSYVAFAMERESYDDCQSIIDQAEAGGAIFVEVANDDEPQ